MPTSYRDSSFEFMDSTPMPTLQQGAAGNVVHNLQTVRTNGALEQWGTSPQGTRD
jgi:hypothetical protein